MSMAVSYARAVNGNLMTITLRRVAAFKIYMIKTIYYAENNKRFL